MLLGLFYQVYVWVEGCEWMQKRQRGGLCLTTPSSPNPTVFYVHSSFLWTFFAHHLFQTNSSAGFLLGSIIWGTSRKLEDSRREKAFCFFGLLCFFGLCPQEQGQWCHHNWLLRTPGSCPGTSLLTEAGKWTSRGEGLSWTYGSPPVPGLEQNSQQSHGCFILLLFW